MRIKDAIEVANDMIKNGADQATLNDQADLIAAKMVALMDEHKHDDDDEEYGRTLVVHLSHDQAKRLGKGDRFERVDWDEIPAWLSDEIVDMYEPMNSVPPILIQTSPCDFMWMECESVHYWMTPTIKASRERQEMIRSGKAFAPYWRKKWPQMIGEVADKTEYMDCEVDELRREIALFCAKARPNRLVWSVWWHAWLTAYKALEDSIKMDELSTR
jgi:hypothetical protein